MGADVNATDNYGDTPAHYTAVSGHVDVLQLLLDAGAALSPLDNWGYTPLDWAIRMYKRGAAQLLLARGARNNKKELPDWLQVGLRCALCWSPSAAALSPFSAFFY